MIPGSRRSLGEGIGYPFQFPWAYLVTQMVKNLPEMQETWIRSLGWEDPVEEGIVTHSSILTMENSHGQRSLVGYMDTTERLSTAQHITY